MYTNEMPLQSFLKDKERAAVLTGVRKRFGNKAGAATVGEAKNFALPMKKQLHRM